MRLLLLVLFLSFGALGQGTVDRVDALLKADREVGRSFWGIHVVELGSGRVIFSRDADKLFTPASNMKLFTAAIALARLGPNYRFVTRLTAESRPDNEGKIGELRLIGGGDPNLSSRVLPYVKGARKPNAFEVIDRFADAVVEQGIRWVDGDIVGDDTAYLWEPYPEGWAVDDLTWEYGAAVSALTLNDSSLQLAVEPAEAPGLPVQVTLTPAVEHVTIQNLAVTSEVGSRGKISIRRVPGSTELVVEGGLSVGHARHIEFIAVGDPALFAAQVLRDALLRRGIRVSGGARARHRLDLESPSVTNGSEFEVATHQSAPLIQALKVVNKESQNLHAEILLREVARRASGIGSREAGVAEMTKFLRAMGIDSKQYSFEDGSGLSRKALVSPSTITSLLAFVNGQTYREAFVDTLPIGGVDGTLSNRFGGKPRQGVRAKTGTVSHVNALSGYLLRAGGERYAFSILVNNHTATSLEVRNLVDKIVLEFLR